MGKIIIPTKAYWGAQTEAARQNFPDTGFKLPWKFIHNVILIKQAAAKANYQLGLLSKPFMNAIVKTCDEIIGEKWDSQFVVDLFQTGSATSTHMNVNEVIARRANEHLAENQTRKQPPIHPNDHVNLGQSSNDVIPTAMHISIFLDVEQSLLPQLKSLRSTLSDHAQKWNGIIKPGRTHLQDATPIRVGQVFSGYTFLIEESIRRIETTKKELQYVALGGTAVGTGINTHPRFAELTLKCLSDKFGIPFYETKNHFSAQSTIDPVHFFMQHIETSITALMKIANDIRWLSCGPRTGFAEFILPALQPGSSIMPGKVNPVVIESFLQIACQVLGACQVVNLAAQRSEFELNVFLPITIYNTLTAIDLFTKGLHHLNHFCLAGIRPDINHCKQQAEKSLAIATPLTKRFGYDQIAKWVKKALEENKTILEIIQEEGRLNTSEDIDSLDLYKMTSPR